jgi:membrane protease YdiL (CAAX protease family)
VTPVDPPEVPARERITWGLGDVVIIWVAASALSSIAVSIVQGARGVQSSTTDDVAVFVGLLGMGVGVLVATQIVSRIKGTGSMARDFGLVFRLSDWRWLVAGALLQLAVLPLVWLLDGVSQHGQKNQQVAQALQDGHGVFVVLAAIGAVTLAPLTEELLFRGVLLRSLLRRCSPALAVLLSALIFGLAHFLDPDSRPLLAPLMLLGVISAVRAVRTGDLSQSIWLHAGFNLLSVAFLLAGWSGV